MGCPDFIFIRRKRPKATGGPPSVGNIPVTFGCRSVNGSESMNLLDRLQLNFRCPANWDDMVGDDQKRFCSHCQKHVHNLSAMTRDEAQALVTSGENLCIRMVRRADGTTKVRDCPKVGDARATTVRRVGMGVAASGALALASCEEEEPPLTGEVCPPTEEVEPGESGEKSEKEVELLGGACPPEQEALETELEPGAQPEVEPEIEFLGDYCPPEAPEGPAGPPGVGAEIPTPPVVPGTEVRLLGRLCPPDLPKNPLAPPSSEPE